jgi:hypothetical protein
MSQTSGVHAQISGVSADPIASRLTPTVSEVSLKLVIDINPLVGVSLLAMAAPQIFSRT